MSFDNSDQPPPVVEEVHVVEEQRGRTIKRTQQQQPRRRRPKSANPRGRKHEESFIERNRRLVSEMSRAIVRPKMPPPPPPPSTRTRRATPKISQRPQWRSTNRIWLDGTGQGMSLWSKKVQSLNGSGASRHAGPSLLTATVLSNSPVRLGGKTSVEAETENRSSSSNRSRAELIASQEVIKMSKAIRENRASSGTPFINASDATAEDDRNAPYLLAARRRCLPETGIQTIVTKSGEQWSRGGGVSAEGGRVAHKKAAEQSKMKKMTRSEEEEWALGRAAVQRLSLRALTHLERNMLKIKSARRSLEQELAELQGDDELESKSKANKGAKKSGEEERREESRESRESRNNKEVKEFEHSMSVDDEVASLVRRSKMVVLRAAMIGSGVATESVESVDFDRYSIQLVMLLRKLRAALHQEDSTGLSFRWKWEDLEQDLTTASREEKRQQQHQAEKREKQRQRKMWRQQMHGGDHLSDNETKAGGEPPKVPITMPADFQQLPAASGANTMATNVAFSSSEDEVERRSNVSGPTLLRSIQRHTRLPMTEHEEALLLTHFEYSPVTLEKDGGITEEEYRIDVQEFMDSMRPPLNWRRQRVVDSLFQRFQETEEGVRIQKWRNGSTSTQLISGTEVWTAYCAFRTLTPVGHRRGHVGLEALDLWLRPVSESKAAEWLVASMRSQKNLLPTVARHPLRREQWDALHRALGARIPNDDIFERVMRATWVFAGQASVRSLAGGENDDSAGPFGVDIDSVSTFMTSVPPALEEDNKVWIKCGGGDDSDPTGSVDRDTRAYWYCAATAERTWDQPSHLSRMEEDARRKETVARKRAALSSLEGVVIHLERDIQKWTTKVREEGVKYGGGGASEFQQTSGLCSSAVSLRGLGLRSVPELLIGEGSVLGSGMTSYIDVTSSSSKLINIVTHLWLDNNDFGASQESLESLQSLLRRVAPNITELSLCSNQLEKGGQTTAMDSFHGLDFPSLLILRLRSNSLRRWPATNNGSLNVKWSSLVDIDLSNNKLASIPIEALRSLVSLTHANFSKNEIVSLPTEPKRGSSQSQNGPVWPSTLLHLDVSKNRLKKNARIAGCIGTVAHASRRVSQLHQDAPTHAV